MRTVFVKPARPGMVVRNPDRLSEILPDAGAVWNLTDYLRRRIADGDVIVVPTPQESAPERVIEQRRPGHQVRKAKEV